MLAAVAFAASAYVFLTLVIGNYLVFAASPSIQEMGSYFLTPIDYLSVVILRFSPFDEGLWAVLAFCGLLLSITGMKMRQNGLKGAALDSLTIIGPAVLVAFEVGVYFLIPSYFYLHATDFVGRVGLGNIITNFTVSLVSAIVLMGRLFYQGLGRRRR